MPSHVPKRPVTQGARPSSWRAGRATDENVGAARTLLMLLLLLGTILLTGTGAARAAGLAPSAAAALGDNYIGQLGNSCNDKYTLRPVAVEGLAHITAV